MADTAPNRLTTRLSRGATWGSSNPAPRAMVHDYQDLLESPRSSLLASTPRGSLEMALEDDLEESESLVPSVQHLTNQIRALLSAPPSHARTSNIRQAAATLIEMHSSVEDPMSPQSLRSNSAPRNLTEIQDSPEESETMLSLQGISSIEPHRQILLPLAEVSHGQINGAPTDPAPQMLIAERLTRPGHQIATLAASISHEFRLEMYRLARHASPQAAAVAFRYLAIAAVAEAGNILIRQAAPASAQQTNSGLAERRGQPALRITPPSPFSMQEMQRLPHQASNGEGIAHSYGAEQSQPSLAEGVSRSFQNQLNILSRLSQEQDYSPHGSPHRVPITSFSPPPSQLYGIELDRFSQLFEMSHPIQENRPEPSELPRPCVLVERKPVEGSCYVCKVDFAESEEVTWCKGVCGQNLHLECFRIWEKVQVGFVKCGYW
jgi:hypothetical protein